MNIATPNSIEDDIDRLFFIAMTYTRNSVGYLESKDKKAYEAAAQMALDKLRPHLRLRLTNLCEHIDRQNAQNEAAVKDLRALGDIINRYRPE